jgi:pectate lyase
VTGGEGGAVVTASNGAELAALMDSNDRLVIFVSGTIQLSGMNHIRSNKSVIGLGNDARIVGGGLYMYRASNIVIRNLTIEGADEDAIGITTESHHIWIDHCTLSNAADGLLDIVRQSSYITVSYNVFRNHVKTMLIGHSDAASDDTGFLKITVHHNWFDGTSSRHPRVRFGQVHVFNNYYTNNAEYGVASTMEADVLVEGNYFLGVANPTFVGFAESGPGDLVERNNVYVGSGTPQTRGPAFEASQYYPYLMDPAGEVPGIVTSQAGAGKM